MRCVKHPPAAHSRAYESEAAARAGCEPCCEQVVAVRASDGLQWGVIPVLIEVDQGEGREPVRQPGVELIANWWNFAEEEVRRERACTEG